jgi:phosphonate transport system substrate-binding protein
MTLFRPILAALLVAVLSWLAPGMAEAAGATLRLGVVVEQTGEPDRLLRPLGVLLDRLRQRLLPAGVEVGELVTARDAGELAQRIARGEVDFVIETVFPTLDLQQRSGGLSPALVVVRGGKREYRSVFFTAKESPIHALADLRGRTLVLQSLRSTSAFALPKAELERAGLAIRAASDTSGGRLRDVLYVLAQTEANQAVWVADGRGDAGAFNDADWTAVPEKVRSQLRIFHETRPLIRGLLSFRTGLDARVRARAEEALTTLGSDEDGRAVLAAAGGITRFEPLTLVDRQELRGLAATLLRPGSPR